MKILVLGAGKMGSFFIDLLSFDHEVGVYEKDPKRLRFTYNCQRFQTLEEIREFKPELVINAVTVKYTIRAFEEVLPYLPKECIISDISSVKTGLKEWYEKSGLPLKRFFNTSGLLYKEMQLKDKLPSMGEGEQLKLLATNGMLVKRPLIINGEKVLVGFKEAEWENINR